MIVVFAVAVFAMVVVSVPSGHAQGIYPAKSIRIIVGSAPGGGPDIMARAIALSERTALVESAGGAFGAVIVREGEIIGEGANRVVAENDPTWHGEIEAIRKACKAQGSFKLRDATLYTSAEPCPMCMAAAYWAGIKTIYYASTNEDALRYGDFDDSMIYGELKKPVGERSPSSRMSVMPLRNAASRSCASLAWLWMRARMSSLVVSNSKMPVRPW